MIVAPANKAKLAAAGNFGRVDQYARNHSRPLQRNAANHRDNLKAAPIVRRRFQGQLAVTCAMIACALAIAAE